MVGDVFTLCSVIVHIGRGGVGERDVFMNSFSILVVGMGGLRRVSGEYFMEFRERGAEPPTN